MMPVFWTLILLILPFNHPDSTSRVKDGSSFPLSEVVAYDLGERITYRVHYGFINAGEAVMRVDNQVDYVNGRPCYKMEVTGRTVGFWRKVVRIEDKWGSFVDTATFAPQRFYMDIQEANHRHKEILKFHHEMDSVTLEKLDKHTGVLKGQENYFIPNAVHDIISGFYYLRNIDFSQVPEGTIMEFNGFFDKKNYRMRIRFDGRTTVKTDMGKKKALILVPVMPDNETFEKDSPITAYLSDDEHKIPIKVKARLVVGSAEVTIKKYYPGRNKVFAKP
ncbi:DUF3108 domain-containing protein [Persicobacter sp. CCB-QB2]|uniref:DUF3108 domain-containing protein n=1 Tax=Persicobacter sp. CCB-QB2 TaxID=1561025 RepID=UPI0006A9BE95|nr:DUF3108 domain-containing protein [Persicobacter sp. CCB-QB2]